MEVVRDVRGPGNGHNATNVHPSRTTDRVASFETCKKRPGQAVRSEADGGAGGRGHPSAACADPSRSSTVGSQSRQCEATDCLGKQSTGRSREAHEYTGLPGMTGAAAMHMHH